MLVMDTKLLAILSCIYLSSLSYLTLGHNINIEGCGTSMLDSDGLIELVIVGGDSASEGKYPWMVSLQEITGRYSDHVCGASVINENWMITAAHCLKHLDPFRYQALVGLQRLSEESDSTVQRMKLSKIVKHPDYDDYTLENDIALLKTAKPIDIAGGYANGICLPQTKRDPTGYATVIGWGYTYWSEDGEDSDTLREVVVPIVPRDSCNEAYDGDTDDRYDIVTKEMICAGSEDKDACTDDSGGPLFQTNIRGVSTLIGLVSRGKGCGDENYPGIYTKVSSFLPWIEKVISKQ